MPIDAIDKGNPDISGDPKATQPLNPRQMLGAQKRTVNRTQLGPRPTGQPKSGGQSAAQANGQPEGEADQKPHEQQPTGDGQDTAQPDKGIGPAWQQLHDGIANILNDPEWMQHPLLRLFADPTSDPGQMGQDLWSATQWWGNVVNAAIDPNAIHASAANIEHDNSVGGRIAQAVFQIHDDPVSEFAWNVMPYVLTVAAEWEPWMWGPAVAAQGPQQLNQLPQAAMSLFGNDLKHPQFDDPMWYARMGSYVVAAALTAKHGGKAAGPLLKFTERMPGLDRFAAHADRIWGGPGGEKTSIKMQGGETYDPTNDPVGHSYANWWNQNAEPLQPGENPIGKTSAKPEITMVRNPDVEGDYGEKVYKEVSSLDPQALPELAQKLGMQANATVREVKARLGLGDPADVAAVRAKSGVVPELRELSPRLSADILEHWDRYGPALGMWGKITHIHEGDADFHNAVTAMKAIPDATIKDRAFRAIRMANGLHADIKAGVHAYGNNLVEALTKGVLSHSRSGDWYGAEMVRYFDEALSLPEEGLKGKFGRLKPDVALRNAVRKAVEDPYLQTDATIARLRDTADNVGGDVGVAARQHALEELNRLEGGEGSRVTRYDSLPEHGKWALDFYRRLEAEIRDEKLRWKYPDFQPQPNYFHRLKVPVKNLDAALKGVDTETRGRFSTAKNRILARAPHSHRAVRLGPSATGDALVARTAHMTTEDANAAIEKWRGQLEADIRKEAETNLKLKAIVDSPARFRALLHAEMPAFSTDIVDGLRGMLREVQALHTHKVMEEAKRTLVLDERDGRWHPLAVSSTEGGQESAPALPEHFKSLHDAESTNNFYSRFGYKAIQGLQSGGYKFHPRFADPINRAFDLHKGDGDGAYALIRKASGGGKHLIMLNPLWHGTNEAGRFGILLGQNPIRTLQTILKYKGLTKELTLEQAQNLWDLKEHEAIEHGLVTPQLHEDVVSDIGKYIRSATGDIEAAEPLDVKMPVNGIKTVAAATLNAVKGVDAWWQNSVSDRFWHQYHQLGVLAYIVKSDDNLMRGMGAGDARIMGASSANRIVGMTSPDRWMYNPTMYKASQSALFAVNWWRTFPGMVLGTYDRMGMKSEPALTHAWALNTAKTIGAMILVKYATDNALNWLMSGHWQYQNPDGYKNQITMDRFTEHGQLGAGNLTAGLPTQLGGKTYQEEEASAADPATGAHMVMEDPITRQWTDLETALGITEAMKMGGMDHWKPEYAAEGTSEVTLARMSPILQALETGSNLDLYNTVKHRALRWVDPRHPYPAGSADAWLAGALNLTPMGYAAQSFLQGLPAQDGTLSWGPWQGTKVPGWAMRAFDPNDPLSPLLSLLGVRGGYPAPIMTDERGLSSDEVTQLHKYTNDWNNYLTKQQHAVQSGGMTWSEFAYNYRQQAAAYSNKVQGLTGGTSDYMQGADGLLSRYEAVYNDPKAFDQNGDINWSYVQRQQDQMQAQTDPATWRQMIALKDKREMQFPVLRAYKDSLQNYKNFQDTWAKQQKPPIDAETLRSEIAAGASSPNFQQYEAKHPDLTKWYAAKKTWETKTKQGFAYGLFTNNRYVMDIVSPSGDPRAVEHREQEILPQIEAEEKAGTYVTPTGQ